MNFTVTFGNKEYKRTSEASYTHASYRPPTWSPPFLPPVAFHKTVEAAQRRAGRLGEVKAVKVT